MQRLLLALQWVVFHAGVLISFPIIVGSGFGLSEDGIGELMRLTFLLTGLGSALQVTLGHGERLIEGPAGPWWAAYLAIVGIAEPMGRALTRIRTDIQGAMIIAGGVMIALALFGVIRRLKYLFTQRIIGVFLLLIAIQISGFGMRGLVTHGIGLFLIGTAVMLFAVLLLIYARGVLKSAAVVLAVAAGWAVSALFGLTDSAVASSTSSVVALPALLPLGRPTVDLGTTMTLALLAVLLIPNQVGSIRAMEAATGSAIAQRRYDRGLAVTGFTNVLCGLSAGIGTTPLAISAGLVSVTRERGRAPFLLGGAVLVAMALLPRLGSFVGSIPIPIASGVLLVSVSSLAVIAIRSLTSEPLEQRSSLTVGLSLLVGTGLMFVPSAAWAQAPFWLAAPLGNGVITGTLVAIVCEHVLFRSGSNGAPEGEGGEKE